MGLTGLIDRAASAAALTFALTFALAQPAQALELRYIGQQILPRDTQFQGTTVGGLSGLDFDAASGRFLALSDDRGRFGAARFYTLRLDLAQFRRSPSPGAAGVEVTGVTTLRDADGAPFVVNRVDPESLRLAGTRWFWSDEGQRSGFGFRPPAVREMGADGRTLRSFAVPAHFAPSGSVAGNDDGDRGIRNNRAFESLTVSHDGQQLWTATENALAQDGAAPSLQQGSPVRLLSFDLASGAAGAEHVYEVSPLALPPRPADASAASGLVELLALGPGQFLALERSYAAGSATPGTPSTGNTVRLYLADVRGASDVSRLPSLRGQAYTPARKTLLLELSSLRHDDGSALATDNLEGMGFGPLWQGRRTLLLVSDDNFSGRQFTQFVALSIDGVAPAR